MLVISSQVFRTYCVLSKFEMPIRGEGLFFHQVILRHYGDITGVSVTPSYVK